MNLLDLPDDVLEHIGPFLDAPAVAAFRAASRTAAGSRLVLADRALEAYFALCRSDADWFLAVMPRNLDKTLYTQVATCLVRGNVGSSGRSWALLTAWSQGADLMTTAAADSLARLALMRGASRALVALVKYGLVDPSRLSRNTEQRAAFFAHPRMTTDPLRVEIALELSPAVVHWDPIWPWLLIYLSALDLNRIRKLYLLQFTLSLSLCSSGTPFAIFEALMDAFYLSRHDPSIAPTPLSLMLLSGSESGWCISVPTWCTK
ncbi:hypothetical protein BC828DRAFT_410055 [Blastocladiella britannica]|nr:hypothetical protein BC828DRAFT_410055 [Blastocladiella britannica]